MKAVFFSCIAPSLRWQSKERLVWRVHNNKAMVRRTVGTWMPWTTCGISASPLSSRQLEEFPLHLKSSTHAHTENNLGESSKGDVKKAGCCFTCCYRHASQLINTQKGQCQLNAGNLMSGLAPSPHCTVGIKSNSSPYQIKIHFD